jgi:hypothetical protein
MRPNTKKRLRVDFGSLKDLIQPKKHVRKEYIGMRLTGVKNNVGKNRNNLLEVGGCFLEFWLSWLISGQNFTRPCGNRL